MSWLLAVLAGLVVWTLVPPPAEADHGPAHVSIRGVDHEQPEGDDPDTTGLTFEIEVEPDGLLLDEDVEVRWGTVPWTATGTDACDSGNHGDYVSDDDVAMFSQLDVPPYTETIEIQVCGDADLEPHETFEVHLLEVTQGDAEIVDGEATGTIWNDDPPGLSVSDGTGQEGEGITFFLRLSHRTVDEVQVRVATRDGTATAGEDYEAFDETVTLPPHSNERTIVIQALEDDVEDQDENFFIDLSMAENATVADATGEGADRPAHGRRGTLEERGIRRRGELHGECVRDAAVHLHLGLRRRERREDRRDGETPVRGDRHLHRDPDG